MNTTEPMTKRGFRDKISNFKKLEKAMANGLAGIQYYGQPFGWNVFLVDVNQFVPNANADYRISAGCRWFTFKEAREHWTFHTRMRAGSQRSGPHRGMYYGKRDAVDVRKRGRGMLALVDVMELSTKYEG